jgi:hypothetical protein
MADIAANTWFAAAEKAGVSTGTSTRMGRALRQSAHNGPAAFGMMASLIFDQD